jgi:hypothetical protein
MNNTCSLDIAGINITLTCDNARLFDELCWRYHAFLSVGTVEFLLDITWKKITSSTVFVIPNISFNSGKVFLSGPNFSGCGDIVNRQAELEIQVSTPLEAVDYFLRVLIALLTFQAGGMMVHGAGILHSGSGYLFFGHSGSGKTTVSRSSVNDEVLNDDLVVLMPNGYTWTMYSTPFWNLTQVEPKPLTAPLVAMYRLVQDKSVFLEPLKPGQALAEFVSNIPIISVNSEQSIALMERSMKLLRGVPVYRLHFLPDDSFWQVITG